MIETPRELPFVYRGMEVRAKLEELALGDPVVELHPRYVL